MSASAEASAAAGKPAEADGKSTEAIQGQQKPAASLEEDDEFEDFPVEGRCQLGLPFVAAAEAIFADCLRLTRQIGLKRIQRYREAMVTCGKRVGTTMILMKTFRLS